MSFKGTGAATLKDTIVTYGGAEWSPSAYLSASETGGTVGSIYSTFAKVRVREKKGRRKIFEVLFPKKEKGLRGCVRTSCSTSRYGAFSLHSYDDTEQH